MQGKSCKHQKFFETCTTSYVYSVSPFWQDMVSGEFLAGHRLTIANHARNKLTRRDWLSCFTATYNLISAKYFHTSTVDTCLGQTE